MAAFKSRRSSSSCTRLRRRATWAFKRTTEDFVWRDCLVAVGIFSILHLMNKDPVVFEGEKNAVVADAQPELAALAREHFHISGKVVLQRIQPLPDPTAQP